MVVNVPEIVNVVSVVTKSPAVSVSESIPVTKGALGPSIIWKFLLTENDPALSTIFAFTV